MKKNVIIVDYGLGNIHSVESAVIELGYNVSIAKKPEDLVDATHIILPGVGSFQHAMENIKINKMDIAIKESIKNGKFILGICLGMQLLCKNSEENGLTNGLGLIDACVIKFKDNINYTIPQIQWNQLHKNDNSFLMEGINDKEFFYFLHTYYVNINKRLVGYVLGETKYCGEYYVSLIEYNNIMAVQFHPEKSGDAGLKLINNFIRKN